LRGLTTDSRCPECGSAVLETVYDDLSSGDELAAIRRELVLAPLRSVARTANVSPDAVLLVHEAVQWSAYELRRKIGAAVPVTAWDICRELGHRVRSRFDTGAEARRLLQEWGLSRGEDVGRVVMALVAEGKLAADATDSEADFAGLFSVDALRRDFD
jgi:uncharacterized repeat protein (TIGR04138 family)